jgi:hypothetical protein
MCLLTSVFEDDRFLIKQMSRYEMDAFLRFAPAYFQYMSEAFFHEVSHGSTRDLKIWYVDRLILISVPKAANGSCQDIWIL